MFAHRPLVALASLALLLAACREARVAAYRVPKEKDPSPPGATADVGGTNASAAAAPAGAGMADTPVATAEGTGLTWTAPADWQATPAGAMRKATYAVTGEGGAKADLSITAFPNSVGGEFANVNRWRGQLQLPPLGEAETASVIARAEHNGLKFAIVDFVGTGSTSPQRMLGAIVPVEGATWFFKLLGPDALVAKAKPAFEAFLATVKPAPSPAAP
jgi:hypothetical protein